MDGDAIHAILDHLDRIERQLELNRTDGPTAAERYKQTVGRLDDMYREQSRLWAAIGNLTAQFRLLWATLLRKPEMHDAMRLSAVELCIEPLLPIQDEPGRDRDARPQQRHQQAPIDPDKRQGPWSDF